MAITPAGRGPQLLGAATFLIALSTITIALRAYTRAFVVKSFGLDDWFAVIAWVCQFLIMVVAAI